jgi:hypothetical protein
MSRISIGFEMTDALITRAVREDCIAFAREHVAPRDVLIFLGSAGVFVLALARESHWIWLLAGLPPAIFALLGAGWLFAFLWLPGVAQAKLAHLPHRRVQVDASDDGLCFQTANERLEVAWRELKALRRRPGFWMICLRSGTRIPIPAELLAGEAESLLKTRLAESEHKSSAG